MICRLVVIWAVGVCGLATAGPPAHAQDTDSSAVAPAEDRAAHGVPPRMLGIIAPGQLGGKGDAETQRRDFASFTVDPLQRRISGWINELIFPAWGWDNYTFSLKSFESRGPEELKTTGEAVEPMLAAGVLSINEAREKLGLDPLPDDWADGHYLISGVDFVRLDGQPGQEALQEAQEEVEIKQSLQQARRDLREKWRQSAGSS